MSFQIGLDAKFYVGSSDIGDVGNTWTEVPEVEEITLNLETAEAEIKNRASDWVKILLGQKNASIDVTITYDKTDTEYDALRDAWLNKTDIAVAVMDGAIATSGNEGLQIDAKVTSFTRNEPLEEGLTINLTLRPSAESANEPDLVEIV